LRKSHSYYRSTEVSHNLLWNVIKEINDGEAKLSATKTAERYDSLHQSLRKNQKVNIDKETPLADKETPGAKQLPNELDTTPNQKSRKVKVGKPLPKRRTVGVPTETE